MTEAPTPNSPRRTFWTLLWNPFTFIAGGPALLLGSIIIIKTGFVASLTNTHFDGILDTHVGFEAPIWFFLAENVINWLALSLVLLSGGFLISRKRSFRPLDLFGTQALARWPFLLTAMATNLPGFAEYNSKLISFAMKGKLTLPAGPISEMLAFAGVTFVMIVATVWFVALAWKSFRISCDARGGKAITTFVVGIIVAEILSKVVFMKGLLPLLKITEASA